MEPKTSADVIAGESKPIQRRRMTTSRATRDRQGPPAAPITSADVIAGELKLVRERRRRVYPKPANPPAETQPDAGEDGVEQEEVPPESPTPPGDEARAVAANGGGEDRARPGLHEQAGGGQGLRNVDQRLIDARLAALDEHTVGVAFSGGGIRSGTFAVGFLQGLARVGLLRRVDYLSTVSGGGYAGGWLAAWLKREENVENVEYQLSPSRVDQARADRLYLQDEKLADRVVDREPQPLYHLRSYSSYMTPRPGLTTVDTWTVLAIWLRNVTINLMVLLPLAAALAFAVRIVVYLYGSVSSEAIKTSFHSGTLWLLFSAVGAVCLVVALGFNGRALGGFRSRERTDPATGKERDSRPEEVGARVNWRIVAPMAVALVCLTIPARAVSWWVGTQFTDGGGRAGAAKGSLARLIVSAPGFPWVARQVRAYPGLAQWPNLVFYAVLIGFLTSLGALLMNLRNGTLTRAEGKWFKFPGAAFLAGATGGLLFALLQALIRGLDDAGSPGLIATFVPPLALAIVVLAFTVEVGLLGRTITEEEREWWSRIAALLLVTALAWAATFATVLYVPAAFLRGEMPLRVALTSGWLGATVLGLVTGRYGLPKRPPVGGSWLATIATVMPPIFLAGLLGAVSLVVAFAVNTPRLLYPVGLYFQGLTRTPLEMLLLGLAGAIAFLLISSIFIDVNLFSLHSMYANRLIRCYLGASRPDALWAARWKQRKQNVDVGAPSLDREGEPARRPNPVTGFDRDDDIPLHLLKLPSEPQAGASSTVERKYLGPHLLINSTLNLVGGKNLAWRDRKGDSFVLSPYYCGALSLGYAEVTGATGANLTLGRAMTISGAAVDPNMKYYQSGALTAFLTIFNARLGYWMQSTNEERWKNAGTNGWEAKSPQFWYLLIKELLGKTDGKGDYVHLSDGGHFENLGVYELIRRRCRYIVAVDAGEDADASNDNLADLVRLARIDFGVRIELDTRPMAAEGPDRLSRTHVVLGRVRYDDVDNGQMPGVLVYVKISMTGDEPADLQKYAKTAPDFPHQPTDLRQAFDEVQFEAYRCLGDHIAYNVFKDAVDKVGHLSFWLKSWDPSRYKQGNQRLFSALRARWAEPPADHGERYLASAREWSRLQHQFRTEPALADLTRDLYPELPADGHAAALPEAERRRAELHAAGQMLQIMEDAWINLGLKGNRDLPMDRGWLNVFRRWTSSATFHRLWPILRSEFSPEFVQFCENELHLTAAAPDLHRLHINFERDDPFAAAAVADIEREYGIEWPAEARHRGIRNWLKRAESLATADRLPAWLIVQSPSGPELADKSPERFACAIIVAAPAEVDDGGKADLSQPIDLLVWVRGPHRSIGLGSKGLAGAIAELRKQLNKSAANGQAPTLRVRYPKSDRGAGTDFELGMWKSFFSLHNFRENSEAAATSWETVLDLRLSSEPRTRQGHA